MSKVQLQGNANGTGIFTIASPNSNTDRTLTLPDNTGTVVTTGSSGAVTASMLASSLDLSGKTVITPFVGFYAYLNASVIISNNTLTKINFDAELFDSNSWFSTSTARFTPQRAGYYYLNAQSSIELASGSSVRVVIQKNGVNYQTNYGAQMNGANSTELNTSTIAYANGTTDYFEIYTAGQVINPPGLRGGATLTYFAGSYLGA